METGTREGNKGGQRRFADYLKTDGVGASIGVKRPKPAAADDTDDEEPDLQTSAQEESDLKATTMRLDEAVVNVRLPANVAMLKAVDPGIIHPVCGVEDGDCKDTPKVSSLLPDLGSSYFLLQDDLIINGDCSFPLQVTSMSLKEYRHISGFNRAARRRQAWLESEEGLLAINASTPTPRSASIEGMQAHLQHVLPSLIRLLQFYGLRRQRNLRFRAYMQAAVGIRAMAERIVPSSFGRKGKVAVVAYGAAGISHAMRGNNPAPVQKIKRYLTALPYVILVEVAEPGTSIACSKEDEDGGHCHHRTKHPVMEKVVRGKLRRVEAYGVKSVPTLLDALGPRRQWGSQYPAHFQGVTGRTAACCGLHASSKGSATGSSSMITKRSYTNVKKKSDTP